MVGDALLRLTAALEGRYTIVRPLGEGGMATVYLADDLKHGRPVAIKVLKPELAAMLGAERFLAEIRTTANLQHPHILPLFDSGEADGFLYYVMPYVEGESLRAKIDREKQLGVEETLRIARAVASALDYAHEREIIHRDIKPANILLHAGQPVVADFGIALAVSAAGGGRMTETGLSLGTPHYMSPEQASADRDLTNRSDVFALACVTYEMLAGVPPHEGPTAQATLMRVLTEVPRPVSQIRPSVPAHVSDALSKALEKLPADRFERADDFGRALEDVGFNYTPGVGRTGFRPGVVPPRSRAVPLMTGALVVMTALGAWGWLRPAGGATSTGAVARGRIDIGDRSMRWHKRIVISPDGRRIAFAGIPLPTSPGIPLDWSQAAIFVRDLEEEEFRGILDADAYSLSFSPDGEWIAYVDIPTGSLRKVSVEGGTSRTITAGEELAVFDAHWGSDGRIVFTDAEDRSLFTVSSDGGPATRVTAHGRRFQSPRLLPEDRGILAREGGDAVLIDPATGTANVVLEEVRGVEYVETGHLLYRTPGGQLWAVRFDPGLGSAAGDPEFLLDGVTEWGQHRFSVSRNGTLVAGLGTLATAVSLDTYPSNVLVVDMDGGETVLPLQPRRVTELTWSPDGKRVAFTGTEPGRSGRGLFVLDVGLASLPQRVVEGGARHFPVWSPDNSRIVFSANVPGSDRDLLVADIGAGVQPRALVGGPGDERAYDWHERGRLVYTHTEGGLVTIGSSSVSSSRLWSTFPADSASDRLHVEVEGHMRSVRLAPQEDLVAYQRHLPGGLIDVQVRSFPDAGLPTLVAEQGIQPRWGPDGNRLFYWKHGGPYVPHANYVLFGESLTAAYPDPTHADSLFVATIRREPTLEVVARELLVVGNYNLHHWDLHPDGDRFIVPRTVEVERVPEHHVMILNWFEALEAAFEEGGR